jgi:enediyne polyketide synthase
LVALASDPGRVEVALRCAATGFQLEHVRAVCRFADVPISSAVDAGRPGDRHDGVPMIGLDPRVDLYGRILFQEGRFRRLQGYRRLRSTGCESRIAGAEPRDWFHHYWPGRLVLGDAAARDAVIHSIQACIPQATILPVGVGRLLPGTEYGIVPCSVRAAERLDDGDLLVYDVEVVDDDGRISERWEGLRLRVVERREPRGEWPAALFGPYLEWRTRDLLPGSPPLSVAVERNGIASGRMCSDRLFRQILGPAATIARRPDGKPEADGRRCLTATHARDWTIAAAGAAIVACDLEPVASRPEATWRDMLGPDRWELAGLLSRRTGEPLTQAATRAWVASECLTKAGVPSRAPLVLARTAGDGGAVILASGSFEIATIPLPDGPDPDRPPLIFGLLARSDDARI